MPAGLNQFLDERGVIDADYEQAAVGDIRFRALLRPDREPSRLAGDMLIVVDSGPPLAKMPTIPAQVAAKPAAEPVIKPAAEPVIKPATGPGTRLGAEPIKSGLEVRPQDAVRSSGAPARS